MKYFSVIDYYNGRKVLIPTSNILIAPFPTSGSAPSVEIIYQGTEPGKKSRWLFLFLPGIPFVTPLADAINIIRQAIRESLSSDKTVIETNIVCMQAPTWNY